MSKKNENEPHCEHGIGFTAEETRGMNWLSSFLQNLAASSAPQAKLAHEAHEAIGKALNKLHDLHEQAHAFEEELDAWAALVGPGLVLVDEDFVAPDKDDLN